MNSLKNRTRILANLPFVFLKEESSSPWLLIVKSQGKKELPAKVREELKIIKVIKKITLTFIKNKRLI